MKNHIFTKKLNSNCALVRRCYVRKAAKSLLSCEKTASSSSDVNLNIHSYYSFSPYSPALSAYSAARRGLKVAGVCDYGSVSGVKEFAKACKAFGLACVCGVELRVREGNDIYSAALYGNEAQLYSLGELLANFRAGRLKKARAVTASFNRRLKKADLSIDFDKEVLAVHGKKKGGTVMAKHIYLAAGEKLIRKFGKGQNLALFIRDKMCLDLSEREYELLCDEQNPFYLYDLVRVLRDNSRDYAEDNELPEVEKIADLARSRSFVFALECKKTDSDEAFYDLVKKAKALGFNAVSFSLDDLDEPALLARVEALNENEMLAFPLEKIEYPRNRFETNVPEFMRKHFLKCAYAAAGNAASVKLNLEDGLFSAKTFEKFADFNERLNVFAEMGKNSV